MRAKRCHDLKVGLCNHTAFFDYRLLMQVERILEINELQTVTKEVVETAWENLVLGHA